MIYPCPICTKQTRKVIEDTHDLYLCQECDHVFQADQEIVVSYDSDYVNEYFKHNSLRQMSILRAGMSEAFVGESGSVLDFGYGSGDYLRVMSKNGWDVFGLDVHGVPLGVKEPERNQTFDLITFFDSLEHLQDFGVFHDYLANCIIISVPIFRCLAKIRSWKHYKPGEHLHYFSDKSIQKLLRYHGFSLSHKTYSEDLIRGKIEGGPNISTFFFARD